MLRELLIAIILMTCLEARTDRYTGYDATFSLTWIPGYCKTTNKCIKFDHWDHQSLVINGLWPQNIEHNFKLNFNSWDLSKNLFYDLKKYMPSRMRYDDPPGHQWQKQLNNHGEDYGSIIRRFKHDGRMDYKEMKVRYFQTMIKEYKNLQVRNIPKAIWKLDELEKHFGMQRSTFQILCNKNNEVRQIRFCYQITKDGLKVDNCQRDNINCRSQIIFDGWKPIKNHVQRPIESEHVDEYTSVLALSWVGGFCLNEKMRCSYNKLQLWDHQSFTIHGFWPNLPKNQQHLRKKTNFNLNLFKGKDVLNNMWNYMSPTTQQTSQTSSFKSKYFLWDHEFDIHGNDYLVVRKNFGSEESDNQLQVQFFEELIGLYKKQNLIKVPKNVWNQEQLADLMGIKTNQFQLRCHSGSKLNQIRICYKITSRGNQITTCKSNYHSPECNLSRLTLVGWQKRDSLKVNDRIIQAGIS